MSWTYDPALSTNKDKVRFLSGDRVTGDQLVSDEEISGMLTLYADDVLRAAGAVCRALAAQFSREADKAIDDMRKSLSQRATAFAARADELAEQASSGTTTASIPVPWAGGISVSDKQSREDDDDRVRPFFTRNDMEFPGSIGLNGETE